MINHNFNMKPLKTAGLWALVIACLLTFWLVMYKLERKLNWNMGYKQMVEQAVRKSEQTTNMKIEALEFKVRALEAEIDLLILNKE